MIIPKVKKIRKVVPRTRNKAVRREYLEALERKQQRIREHQENHMTLVERAVDK